MSEDGRPWYLVYEKRRWVVLVIAWTIAAIVWHFSTLETTAGAVGTLMLVYILAEIMSNFWKEKWLWVSLFVIGSVHLVIIALIPYRLPSQPAILYVVPIFMTDGFVMWAILLWLAAKFSRKLPRH